jgi:hypothetical protein
VAGSNIFTFLHHYFISTSFIFTSMSSSQDHKAESINKEKTVVPGPFPIAIPLQDKRPELPPEKRKRDQFADTIDRVALHVIPGLRGIPKGKG